MREPGRAAERRLARVLGPVRIPDPSGALVEPPGALPKRLIVALALAGADGRSIAGLTDDLWAEEPPRNPRGALQMLVSRTRAVAAADLVTSSPVGYRLAGSDLDVAERAARNGGDDGAALALWSGSPGADLDDPGLAGELAARAARARERLLGARASALVRSDPAAALRDLDELTAADPLAAEPQRLRMTALAAAGRLGEALASFAVYRERLADALGTEPDPALAELHTELLRAGGEPGATEVVGVRAAATRLLGREEDVRRLLRGVPEHRLTSIVGAGGLGKTRLAHEVAGGLAARFGRVVFVELAGAREDADVALVLGAAVGARAAQARRRLNDPTPPDLATRTREVLAARPTLLVLDNCEQVIDAVASLTAELLATVPSLTVLTTTRVPLLLPGERIHALQPLDAATDAVDLFLERAAAARPGARLDAGTVQRICTHLDGLPLAIELAAARLRSMTIDELDRALSDRFAVLVGGDRTAPERHRTLFAVIDWSWQLLREDSRRALRLLAVFPDGFTAEGASGMLRGDAPAAVADLVDQSLLTFAEAADGSGRYRMLETVREFGLRALAQAGETTAAAEGLDRFALAFARRVHPGLTGGLDPASGVAVAADEETLLAVLRSPPAGREQVVLAVFALLAEFRVYRGEFDRVPELLPTAVAAGRRRPVGDEERDETLRALTLAAALAGLSRTPGHLRLLAQLRRVRAALPAGADGFWATFSAVLFMPLSNTGALAGLEELTATAADPLVATFSSLIIGQLAENSGRIRDAIEAATRSQRLAERHGYAWFRLIASMTIAQLHSQRAERATALRLALEALDELTALDVRADVGQLDWTIAVNQAALGLLDEAEVRFARLAATEPAGRASDGADNRSIGFAGLAELAGFRGEAAAAEQGWAAAVRTADEASAPWRVTIGAAALAAGAAYGRPAGSLEAGYRRLRGRVLALTRFPREVLDVPVLASGVVGLAAVLLADGRSTQQQAVGAELVALAVPFGARLDFPSLATVPGVAEALAIDGPPPPRDETVSRIVALLTLPAARPARAG